MKAKSIKRILIVAGFVPVALAVSYLGERATGRIPPPPPPRAVPSGASLVEGGTAPSSVEKKKTVDLSFDTLKKWTYVKGKSDLPNYIRQFDGQRVEMAGYMMTLQDVVDIDSFVLVPSLFGCCYGQPPSVNHVVLVKMTGGATVKFIGDPLKVRGIFHCSEEKQDGYLVSLYRLDADQVVAK
jgi:hypothetical protein